MKVKTSITLSDMLIEAIDKNVGDYKSRSDFIENALWVYFNYLLKQEKNKQDLAIINKNYERLNEEAADVLDYQVSL